VGKVLRRSVTPLIALALIVGGAWFFWLNPEAPQRGDLNLDQPTSAPTRHVTPTVPADLQAELDHLGYKPQAAVAAGPSNSTGQLWDSTGRPQVELNDLGSGIYKVHTFTYEGGAGSWKFFWCAPSGADEKLLEHTINASRMIRNDIDKGSARPKTDADSSLGIKYVRRTDAVNQWTLTCYVWNG